MDSVVNPKAKEWYTEVDFPPPVWALRFTSECSDNRAQQTSQPPFY